MMNRLKKKSIVKHASAGDEPTASSSPTSPVSPSSPLSPFQPPSLDFDLPESDFRSSVILPDLGRRFSLLSRADPASIQARLEELRTTGGTSLSPDEEVLVLEELKRLRVEHHHASSASPAVHVITSPMQMGHPLRPRIDKSGYQEGATVSSPTGRSLFGGSGRDHLQSIRRAQRSMSAKTLAATADDGGAGKGKARELVLSNSESHDEVLDGGFASSPGVGRDDSGFSPVTSPLNHDFPSLPTSSSFTMPFDPPITTNTSSSFDFDFLSGPPLSLASTETLANTKRKSLLDTLTPEQMKRVSATIAKLEHNVGIPPSALQDTSDWPNEHIATHTLSRSASCVGRLATVVEPEGAADVDDSFESLPIEQAPSSTQSLASSVASSLNGASPQTTGSRRNGSISIGDLGDKRLSGYIPGMPRPITPSKRSPSSASFSARQGSSSPLLSTHSPTASAASSQPMVPSPSSHLPRSSVSTPRRFLDVSSPDQTHSYISYSYASSGIASHRNSEAASESEAGPDDGGTSQLAEIQAIDTALPLNRLASNGQLVPAPVPEGRFHRSSAPSPEPAADEVTQSSELASSSHVSLASTSSSSHHRDSHLESGGRFSSGHRGGSNENIFDGHSLDPSRNRGFSDSGSHPRYLSAVSSSSQTSSYGGEIPTALGVSQSTIHSEQDEEQQPQMHRLDPEQKREEQFVSVPPSPSLIASPPPSASSHSDPHVLSRYASSSRAMNGHGDHYSTNSHMAVSSFGGSVDFRHHHLQSASETNSFLLDNSVNNNASSESLDSLASSYHSLATSEAAALRGVSAFFPSESASSELDVQESVGLYLSPRGGEDPEKTLATVLDGISRLDLEMLQARLVATRTAALGVEMDVGAGLYLPGTEMEEQLNARASVGVEGGTAVSLSVPTVQDQIEGIAFLHSPPPFTTPVSNYSATFSTLPSNYHADSPPSQSPHTGDLHSRIARRPSQAQTPPSLGPAAPIDSPRLPLSPKVISDPSFVSDVRRKIDAADAQMQTLRESPSMPRIGGGKKPSRSKSLKRNPPQISSPTFVSSTAYLHTTPLSPPPAAAPPVPEFDQQQQQQGGASLTHSKSMSQRFRKLTNKRRGSAPVNEGHPDGPTQPIMAHTMPSSGGCRSDAFSRPSLDQVIFSNEDGGTSSGVSSQTQRGVVFPAQDEKRHVAPASPLPKEKVQKARRGFLNLLRPRKTSTAANSLSTVVPLSASALSDPSPSLSRGNGLAPLASLNSTPPPAAQTLPSSARVSPDRTPTISTAPFAQYQTECLPIRPFPSLDAPFSISGAQPPPRNIHHSRDEGSIDALFDAASRLGIDPLEVDSLLKRSASTSGSLRGYHSRASSFSRPTDLHTPTLSRSASVVAIPEEEHLAPAAADVAFEDAGELSQHQRQQQQARTHLASADHDASAAATVPFPTPSDAVQSALHHSGWTASKRNILRRTIILPSEASLQPPLPADTVGRMAPSPVPENDVVPPSMSSPLSSKFQVHSFESGRSPSGSSSNTPWPQRSRTESESSEYSRGGQQQSALPSDGSLRRHKHESGGGVSSFYDSYYEGDEDEGRSWDRPTSEDRPPSRPFLLEGQAIEVLEMDNGDVVYSVLAGLRDLEGFDDEAWDGSAEPSDRGSFNGSAVSSVDEPVQLTFRGQRSATSGLDVQGTRRNPFKTSAHSLIRPETKVFYSSSQQVAELIAEISKGHDQGTLQFATNNTSPTTDSFPASSKTPAAPLNLPKRSISISRRKLSATSRSNADPFAAPLNLPKRSISISRRKLSATARSSADPSAAVDTGRDSALSSTPSGMGSAEGNIERMMISLLQADGGTGRSKVASHGLDQEKR